MGSGWAQGNRWKTLSLPEDIPWIVKLLLPSSVKVQKAMPGRNRYFGNGRRDPIVPFAGGYAGLPNRHPNFPQGSQRSDPAYCDFHERYRRFCGCPGWYNEQRYGGNGERSRDVRIVSPQPSYTLLHPLEKILTDRQRRGARMQKRYLCWGCQYQRFDTLPDMIKHLENGTCDVGWKIQHINALAAECLGSQSYIIQNQQVWLLAGAPERTRIRRCYNENMDGFCCPNCSGFFESKSIFAKHLEKCCGYPFVLQCPHCPINMNKFFRVSELLEHVEGQRCSGNKNDEIWEDLRDGLWKNLVHRKTQYRLNRFSYKLLPPKRGRGKLEVNVKENDENERRGLRR